MLLRISKSQISSSQVHSFTHRSSLAVDPSPRLNWTLSRPSPEICDYLLDFCAYDSEDNFENGRALLHACALTCRGWLPRSQRHLYHYVDLPTHRHFGRFLTTITAQPEHAILARELVLGLGCGDVVGEDTYDKDGSRTEVEKGEKGMTSVDKPMDVICLTSSSDRILDHRMTKSHRSTQAGCTSSQSTFFPYPLACVRSASDIRQHSV